MKKISYRCVEDANKATRLEPVFLSVLMAVIFITVLPAIPYLGMEFLKGLGILKGSLIGDAIFSFLEISLVFGFTLISIFLWVKYYQGRKISTIGFYKEGWLKNYVKGSLIGILMFSLVMIILYVSGNAHIDKSPTIATGFSALGAVLILAPGWMIQSATEEALTRGWLLSTVSSHFGLIIGVVVSSSFFGIIHAANDGVTVFAIVNIILVGVALSIISIYYNNIWVASGVHFTWNMFQGNVYGVPVSGSVYGNASIVQTKLSGSEMITGGSFGPEAGVIASIVIIGVSIIYLVLLFKRKKTE